MKRKRKIYYNTTGETGEYIRERETKAVSQELDVLAIFKTEKRPLTASEVWNIHGALYVPLTSIRRAMTNLKIDGVIIKTEFKKTGIYGQPESYYTLPKSNEKNKKRANVKKNQGGES